METSSAHEPITDISDMTCPPDLSLLPVMLPILWMKDREKGMGCFIFRKKQAGRSTQLEFEAGENVGVLKWEGGIYKW